MPPVSRPIAGIACVVVLMVTACTPDPPTAPAPRQPPVVSAPPPSPPPPAPPVGIAGKYRLAVSLSRACTEARLEELFGNRAGHARARLYEATISGANTASVDLVGDLLRHEPVWDYGTGFGIIQEQDRVTLSSWEGWVPDIMEAVAPDEWLFISIHGGSGEVQHDRIEVVWTGEVSLVRPEDNWSTALWQRIVQCEARDHELTFTPVE